MLEDEAHAAGGGFQVGDVLVIEANPPAVGKLEPGDDPEQGRLARSRGAEQGKELAVARIEADVVKRGVIAERLADIAERNAQCAAPAGPWP